MSQIHLSENSKNYLLLKKTYFSSLQKPFKCRSNNLSLSNDNFEQNNLIQKREVCIGSYSFNYFIYNFKTTNFFEKSHQLRKIKPIKNFSFHSVIITLIKPHAIEKIFLIVNPATEQPVYIGMAKKSSLPKPKIVSSCSKFSAHCTMCETSMGGQSLYICRGFE